MTDLRFGLELDGISSFTDLGPVKTSNDPQFGDLGTYKLQFPFETTIKITVSRAVAVGGCKMSAFNVLYNIVGLFQWVLFSLLAADPLYSLIFDFFFKGSGFTQGCTQDEISVQTGVIGCDIVKLSDSEIECEPPKSLRGRKGLPIEVSFCIMLGWCVCVCVCICVCVL
jgi:hypothetical protein